jgi:transcriptional regulator of met regulon
MRNESQKCNRIVQRTKPLKVNVMKITTDERQKTQFSAASLTGAGIKS